MKQSVIWVDSPDFVGESGLKDLQSAGLSHIKVALSAVDAATVHNADQKLRAWNDSSFILRTLLIDIAGVDSKAYLYGLYPQVVAETYASMNPDWNLYLKVEIEDKAFIHLMKRVQTARLADESWWPAHPSIALFFPQDENKDYQLSIDTCLLEGDGNRMYDLAFKPFFDYHQLLELMKSAVLYAHGGGLNRFTPMCTIITRSQARDESPVSRIVRILSSNGYQILEGEGMHTVLHWLKHGQLPDHLVSILPSDDTSMPEPDSKC